MTLPEGKPENTTQSSVNQTLDTTSRFWEVPEARFSPMTYMSKVGKGTVPRNRDEHTVPGRLRPPFFCLAHCPGSGRPSCCFHGRSARGTLPTLFLKGLFPTILGLRRGKFLTERLDGRHSACLSQTCKVSHFIYSCGWCHRHPCPAQTRTADGATWEPGHHMCKISTAMGTELPARLLLPHVGSFLEEQKGSPQCLRGCGEKGDGGNTRKKRC